MGEKVQRPRTRDYANGVSASILRTQSGKLITVHLWATWLNVFV